MWPAEVQCIQQPAYPLASRTTRFLLAVEKASRKSSMAGSKNSASLSPDSKRPFGSRCGGKKTRMQRPEHCQDPPRSVRGNPTMAESEEGKPPLRVTPRVAKEISAQHWCVGLTKRDVVPNPQSPIPKYQTRHVVLCHFHVCRRLVERQATLHNVFTVDTGVFQGTRRSTGCLSSRAAESILAEYGSQRQGKPFIGLTSPMQG
jgi:hypothetical protein